jgi:DNA-binding FrmR family transcriptional regulator
MASISDLPESQRHDLTNRLKKIEGQARGIQKMIDDGRDCLAIMDQMASVKSAVASLNGEMLEAFALHCLSHPDDYPSPQAAVEQMVKTLVRHTR